jgi:hypothetical protein
MAGLYDLETGVNASTDREPRAILLRCRDSGSLFRPSVVCSYVLQALSLLHFFMPVCF